MPNKKLLDDVGLQHFSDLIRDKFTEVDNNISQAAQQYNNEFARINGELEDAGQAFVELYDRIQQDEQDAAVEFSTINDKIDAISVPENLSELNNDVGYINNIEIVNNLVPSQGIRDVAFTSINGERVWLPGHTMAEVGPVKDDQSTVVYAHTVKHLSGLLASNPDEESYAIPVYPEEITYPKQVVTKEYVDNAIANAPAADYSSLKNLPNLPEYNIASYLGKNASPSTGDNAYYLTYTDISDGSSKRFDVAAYPEHGIPQNKNQVTTKGYVDEIDEKYDKLLKAFDKLVADQGKGARSADGDLYDTAMEAINDAQPGVPMEVALTQDENNGPAFLLMNAEGDEDMDITFDLNGHEYLATQAGGSPNTQTQAVHLEKGNTVVIKGGSLSAAVENPQIKMLIQNYANLTLEDMEIDCSDNSAITYVVSNNFGTCLIKNCHIVAAPGKVAVDCWFGLNNQGLYDDGVHVFIENSHIDGDIEYGAQRQALSREGNERWWEKATLEITNSIVTGEIKNSGAGQNDQCTIVIDGRPVESLPVVFNN